MKLHLGVIDIPYAQAQPVARASAKPRAAEMTTGGVARILEDKYAVMGNFAALHERDIAEVLAVSLTESLETLAAGAPSTFDVFGQAAQDVEQMFRQYLRDEEIVQTGQAGVPTGAALTGASSRFKKKRGPRRPSFIDTGLYQANMKAWVE